MSTEWWFMQAMHVPKTTPLRLGLQSLIEDYSRKKTAWQKKQEQKARTKAQTDEEKRAFAAYNAIKQFILRNQLARLIIAAENQDEQNQPYAAKDKAVVTQLLLKIADDALSGKNRNFATAKICYQAASVLGSPAGSFNCGVMLENGMGEPANLSAAIPFYHKARQTAKPEQPPISEEHLMKLERKVMVGFERKTKIHHPVKKILGGFYGAIVGSVAGVFIGIFKFGHHALVERPAVTPVAAVLGVLFGFVIGLLKGAHEGFTNPGWLTPFTGVASRLSVSKANKIIPANRAQSLIREEPAQSQVGQQANPNNNGTLGICNLMGAQPQVELTAPPPPATPAPASARKQPQGPPPKYDERAPLLRAAP